MRLFLNWSLTKGSTSIHVPSSAKDCRKTFAGKLFRRCHIETGAAGDPVTPGGLAGRFN